MDITNQEKVPNFTVSNEMLYELIKDFKSDVNRRFDEVDKRFEANDRRFEANDRRFESMDKRFDRIEATIQSRFDELKAMIIEEREERKKMQIQLDEIYKERKYITVRFTSQWAMASFFIAMLASVSALGIDKAF